MISNSSLMVITGIALSWAEMHEDRLDSSKLTLFFWFPFFLSSLFPLPPPFLSASSSPSPSPYCLLVHKCRILKLATWDKQWLLSFIPLQHFCWEALSKEMPAQLASPLCFLLNLPLVHAHNPNKARRNPQRWPGALSSMTLGHLGWA